MRTVSSSATARWSALIPDITPPARTSSSSWRFCCERGRGAFDFNSRFYADDDLMAGAADPYQLFRIMHEIVQAGALSAQAGVTFMLDQCHNIEQKIPAVSVRS